MPFLLRLQISANEKFSKIVEVLRTKTKSEQVVSPTGFELLICGKLSLFCTTSNSCSFGDLCTCGRCSLMSKTVYGQFVYLKESFCPSLDEKISVLYEVRSKPVYIVWHLHTAVFCTCAVLKNTCVYHGPAGLWERGSLDCQLRKRTCLGLITPEQPPGT